MSVLTVHTPVVLEPASQASVEATAIPPFLHELTADEARKAQAIATLRQALHTV